MRRVAMAATAVVLLGVVVLVGIGVQKSRSTTKPAAATRRDMPPAGTAMPGMPMSSDGSVVLAAGDERRFGVTFGTVEMRELSRELRTVGTVGVDESRLTIVSPRFDGIVEQLFVNFTGQPVRRGQPMAAVFSPDIFAAEQELLVASRLSRGLGGNGIPGVPGSSIDLVAAAKQRLRFWNVPDAQISAVLRTGRPFRTVAVYAPFSGVVLEKNVVSGQAIKAGSAMYTLADLSQVWVDAQLREADAGLVSQGTSATLDFQSYPGRPFTGRVTYVYPTLGEQSRTVRARITVANGNLLLKPGMFATVRLNTSARSALSVPVSAVLQTGERALVFVDKGGGRLTPQTVTLGGTGSEFVEVLTGLSRGQRVVTSAQFLIDSESNLGDAMAGMAMPPRGKAP